MAPALDPIDALLDFDQPSSSIGGDCYEDEYKRAVQYFADGRYAECEGVYHSLLESASLPPLQQIRCKCLLATATNSWVKAEELRAEAEALFHLCKWSPHFCNTPSKVSMGTLREMLDELAKDQRAERPANYSDHVAHLQVLWDGLSEEQFSDEEYDDEDLSMGHDSKCQSFKDEYAVKSPGMPIGVLPLGEEDMTAKTMLKPGRKCTKTSKSARMKGRNVQFNSALPTRPALRNPADVQIIFAGQKGRK
ncbi:Eukaryotic translation initiation factor 3 subunit B [Sphaceloma murrayae]|uniref:Eukaryotic translation initiation factor 3 subunit B n=1 Tax=Sphaceloma murrayae TaxID=2082308 RepID=A0A2K1QIY6_9PEZI|nr:Eukaryotic translation initiation factor 3 subunit B [Sphaceloma murrayae]